MLKVNLEELVDFENIINEELDLDKINELSNICIKCTKKNKKILIDKGKNNFLYNVANDFINTKKIYLTQKQKLTFL